MLRFDRCYLVFRYAWNRKLDTARCALERDVFLGAQKLHARNLSSTRKVKPHSLCANRMKLAIPAAVRVRICIVQDVQREAGFRFPRESFDQAGTFDVHWLVI